jgi:hypothetical protein
MFARPTSRCAPIGFTQAVKLGKPLLPQGRERGAVLGGLVRCLDTRHSHPIIPVRDYSQGRGISDNGCWLAGRRAKALGGWGHENGLAPASAREM